MAKKSQQNAGAKSEREARSAAMRAEREKAARASERRTRLIIGVAVLLGVALVAVALFSNRGSAGGDAAAVPQGVEAPDGGVVRVADTVSDDAVAVDEWLDFQCPACKSFHESLDATVDELVAAGEIEFTVHPLSFINQGSKRAANAYGCAVDAGREGEYYDQLFLNQGPEADGGYTVEQLLALAEPAGITGDALSTFERCVQEDSYSGWVANVADRGIEEGVVGTPTIFMNGEEIDLADYTPETFQEAVEAARG
jgi:protein-disulfide isomerase